MSRWTSSCKTYFFRKKKYKSSRFPKHKPVHTTRRHNPNPTLFRSYIKHITIVHPFHIIIIHRYSLSSHHKQSQTTHPNNKTNSLCLSLSLSFNGRKEQPTTADLGLRSPAAEPPPAPGSSDPQNISGGGVARGNPTSLSSSLSLLLSQNQQPH